MANTLTYCELTKIEPLVREGAEKQWTHAEIATRAQELLQRPVTAANIAGLRRSLDMPRRSWVKRLLSSTDVLQIEKMLREEGRLVVCKREGQRLYLEHWETAVQKRDSFKARKVWTLRKGAKNGLDHPSPVSV